MPLHRGAAAARQQAEALAESLRDLGRCQRPDAGRGELDRERDAVEAPADLQHRADVAFVDGEVGADGRRPLREETDGVAVEGRLEAGALGCDAEAPDDDEPLARHAEALPARREDRDPGAPLRDLAHDVGHRGDHVLAVVEHEEQLLALQVVE